MSDSTSSAAAHAESDAHHASICKAATCGSGSCCTCGARVHKLETTVKRIRYCLWGALVVFLVLVAFAIGRHAQGRHGMMQRGQMGQMNHGGPMQGRFAQGMQMPGGQMQGGPMRGGQMQGRMNAPRDGNQNHQPRPRDRGQDSPPQAAN